MPVVDPAAEKRGTPSSTEAVQITLVLPVSKRTEPSAFSMKLGWILLGVAPMFRGHLF